MATDNNAEKKQKPNAGKARSMSRITEALLRLMRDKPFDDISVTELCEAAGVVRKTFYRNFESKASVVEYEFDRLFSAMAERFDVGLTPARNMLAFCFEYLNSERDFCAVFIDSGLHDVVKKKIRECVETSFAASLHNAVTFEPMLSDYYTSFIADGVLSIFRTWILGGCKQSPAVIARLSVRLLGVVIT